MRCPYCNSEDSNVIDTRPQPHEPGVRRRRECPKCGGRFSTRERFDLKLPQVRKRDGREQPYDRAKLSQGVYTAVKKLKLQNEEIERIIDTVELEIAAAKVSPIESTFLGDAALKRLYRLNPVAALRFASVYLRFDDLASFIDQIEKIKEIPPPDAFKNQIPLMEDGDPG